MDLIKCQFMTIIILLALLNIGLLIGVIVKVRRASQVCKKNLTYPKTFSLVGPENLLTARKYPFVVSIKVVESDGFSTELHCGGAIVDMLWLLTAAHCVQMLLELPRENIIICDNTQLWNCIIRHEVVFMTYPNNYNSKTFNADVGLIKVKRPFERNIDRKIIVVNKYYDYKINNSVTAVGWAENDNAEEYSYRDVLSVVNILILDDTYCKKVYKNTGTELETSMFCAGSYDDDKPACRLDSGSPLLYKEMLIGIASWGRDCGKLDQPIVYTKVSRFRDWIRDVIKTK